MEKKNAEASDDDDDDGSSAGAVIAVIILLCLAIIAGALVWVFRDQIPCFKKGAKSNQTTIDPDESARQPAMPSSSGDLESGGD